MPHIEVAPEAPTASSTMFLSNLEVADQEAGQTKGLIPR